MKDEEYTNFDYFGRSYLKTVDFTVNKDEFRFSTLTGLIIYVLGLLYLNIIILNLVIASVGDIYDEVMQVRKETELKLKAELLKELYDLKSTFIPQDKEVGNLFTLRLANSHNCSEEWKGKVNTVIQQTKESIDRSEASI